MGSLRPRHQLVFAGVFTLLSLVHFFSAAVFAAYLTLLTVIMKLRRRALSVKAFLTTVLTGGLAFLALTFLSPVFNGNVTSLTRFIRQVVGFSPTLAAALSPAFLVAAYSDQIESVHHEPTVDLAHSVSVMLALGGLVLLGVAYVASLVLGRFPYVWSRLAVYEAIVGVFVAALYVGSEPD